MQLNQSEVIKLYLQTVSTLVHRCPLPEVVPPMGGVANLIIVKVL